MQSDLCAVSKNEQGNTFPLLDSGKVFQEIIYFSGSTHLKLAASLTSPVPLYLACLG